MVNRPETSFLQSLLNQIRSICSAVGTDARGVDAASISIDERSCVSPARQRRCLSSSERYVAMKFEGRLEGKEASTRPVRIGVSFDARVRCGARDISAQIHNLSATGFCLRSSRALEPGTEVTLQVGKLPPVKAMVRWVRGQDAGGVFVEPLAL
jgi:hypothetical protein